MLKKYTKQHKFLLLYIFMDSTGLLSDNGISSKSIISSRVWFFIWFYKRKLYNNWEIDMVWKPLMMVRERWHGWWGRITGEIITKQIMFESANHIKVSSILLNKSINEKKVTLTLSNTQSKINLLISIRNQSIFHR
jgi:hypothetical protein